MAPSRDDPSRRRLRIVLMVICCVFLARMAARGTTAILQLSDFEVFVHAGEMAAGHDSRLYEIPSSHRDRPFLYPPSAAIAFVPLSWLPEGARAALFSVLKVACLALLSWGALRWSGAPPVTAVGMYSALLLLWVVLFRFIDGDMGNGQVNLLVAAVGIGGIWLQMRTPSRWLTGSLLLGLAIAIKLTPALLLTVPLLHRRWKAVLATVFTTMVLMVAVPALWFGPSHLPKLMAQQRVHMHDFNFRWPALKRQTTYYEMVQFTRYKFWGEAVLMPEDTPPEDMPLAGFRRVNVRPMVGMWLVIGLVLGGGFLVLRRGVFGDGASPWAWDLAMLCVLLVFMSPRAHKAHLVMLIVPMGWVIARMLSVVEQVGWRGLWSTHRNFCLASTTLFALLLMSDDLPVPAPGAISTAYHPALFVAMLLFMGLLIVMGRDPEGLSAGKVTAKFSSPAPVHQARPPRQNTD